MKKYKALKVPNNKGTALSLDKIQQLYCNSVDVCVGVDCVDCLFYVDNLKIFKQWYKAQQLEKQ